MSAGFSTPAAVALMTALRDLIDAGSAAGYVELYGNARPANGGAPAADSLIATMAFADPCGTVNGSGMLVIAQGPVATVGRALTPTWVRVYDSGGNRIVDWGARLSGTAANPSDPEELVVDAPSLSVGAYVRILIGLIGV